MIIKHFIFSTIIILISACTQSTDSKTINTSSAGISTLEKKVALLEKHITFRRTYHQLDYFINIQDNSTGLLSAPSDWDIGIIAVVPKNEIALWVSDLKRHTGTINKEWLSNIPTKIDAHNIQEWYQQAHHLTVGIDRKNNIIAYRNFTY